MRACPKKKKEVLVKSDEAFESVFQAKLETGMRDEFQHLGTGSALPATIITNDDLSRIVDTSDEWIRSRTGIGQRRVCTTETITDLAYQAALAALENSGCRAEIKSDYLRYHDCR